MSPAANRPAPLGGDRAHLSLDGLAKVYETRTGSVEALQDIALRVGYGEFISIIGPSGCGKSTLLKIVLGVIGFERGAAYLHDRAIDGPQIGAGMVFQQPALPPWRRVLSNILLPIDVLGLPRRDYEERAHHLLSLVGLTGFEDKYPRELSGGMQQRVAICRALIHDPELLLMDEPFGALDAMTREVMQAELMRIWQESGKTILFVTHSIDEAVLLSDRVVVMSPRPGRVLDEVPIDLPRPRHSGLRQEARFQEHAQHFRELLGLSDSGASD
jgi:NitT/TauT family transport system ATP-binding protein